MREVKLVTYRFRSAFSHIFRSYGPSLLFQLVVWQSFEVVHCLAELHVLQAVLQGKVTMEQDSAI